MATNKKQYSLDEIKDIAAALGISYKNDPASTTLGAPTLHGPNSANSSQFGLLSQPGARPDRLSAISRPNTLARVLGVEKSEYAEEILEIMTGVDDGSGTNASGFCANPPSAGSARVMSQIYRFGDYYIKSNLNAIPLTGQLRNRAEVPGAILNAGPESNPLVPDILYRMTNTRSQLAYEMWQIGISLERSLERTLITGDITQAYTATERGWIKEFNGLDQLVKTGYTDSVTSTTAPAADSIVINFGTTIGATIAGGDGRSISVAMDDLLYGLTERAAAVGMDGTEFAVVMRRELFRMLTHQIACNYAVDRCAPTSAGTPVMRDGMAVRELELSMLRGQYLLLGGVQYPAVFSDGIALDPAGANNTFTSDIYVVPLSWQGMRLLKIQYFDLGNPFAQEYSNFTGTDKVVINDGMFLVGKRSTGLCDEYHIASRMRLILEAPFLAGRLDNVTFTYQAATRDAYPGTSLYAAGGVTYRT